jgi:hypothetical protein
MPWSATVVVSCHKKVLSLGQDGILNGEMSVDRLMADGMEKHHVGTL